jgi:hypothetical protein
MYLFVSQLQEYGCVYMSADGRGGVGMGAQPDHVQRFIVILVETLSLHTQSM